MFRRLGEKFGGLIDGWWRAGLIILGTLTLALVPTPEWNTLWKDPFKWVVTNEWLLGGGLLGAFLCGWPAISEVLKTRRLERELLKLEADLKDNWAKYDLLTRDILIPLEARLRDIVVTNKRSTALGGKCSSFAATAVGMIRDELRESGAGRSVRVNYYRLKKDDDGPYLEAGEQSRDLRRRVITAKDPEGAHILERVLAGRSKYCEDLQDPAEAAERPDPAIPHAYRCFLSVSVTHEGQSFGMISANSEEVASIPQSAETFMQAIGGLIVIADEHAGLVSGHVID